MIHSIVVHTCASPKTPKEVLQEMIDIAEKYNCTVSGEINGISVNIEPHRVDDIMRRYGFRQ